MTAEQIHGRLALIYGTLCAVGLVVAFMLAGGNRDVAHAQGQASFLTSDTFTALGTGAIVNVTNNPVSLFGVQLKGTGAAATTATCVLEGSLNGANYTTILTFGADGVMVWQAAGVLNPVAFFRVNCSVITLGPATNVVAKVIAIS